MIDLDPDLLILHVESDVTDRPWRGQSKDVLVETYVLHWGFPSPKIPPLPTQTPDGPDFAKAAGAKKVMVEG
jgi:hypothetical protein